MTKGKQHTQLFHTLLEPMAYFKFTAYETSFIFVLWRFTYGLKGMTYKKAAGKSMPWLPSLFRYKGGIPAHKVSETKTSLARDRIINVNRDGTIGFHKRWQDWKRTPRVPKAEIERRIGVFPKDFTALLIQVSQEDDNGLPEEVSVTPTGKSKTYLKQEKVLPETVKRITSDSKSTGSTLGDSKGCAPPIDKERKGKINKGDGAKAPDGVSLKEEKSDPIRDGYCDLWNKYFLGGRDKKGENFKGTLFEYRRLVDGEETTVGEVQDALVKFKLDLERLGRSYETYPFLKTWLKEERWVEIRNEPKIVGRVGSETYTQEELDYAKQCWVWFKKYRELDMADFMEDRKAMQENRKAQNHYNNMYYIRAMLEKEKQDEQT